MDVSLSLDLTYLNTIFPGAMDIPGPCMPDSQQAESLSTVRIQKAMGSCSQMRQYDSLYDACIRELAATQVVEDV